MDNHQLSNLNFEPVSYFIGNGSENTVLNDWDPFVCSVETTFQLPLASEVNDLDSANLNDHGIGYPSSEKEEYAINDAKNVENTTNHNLPTAVMSSCPSRIFRAIPFPDFDTSVYNDLSEDELFNQLRYLVMTGDRPNASGVSKVAILQAAIQYISQVSYEKDQTAEESNFKPAIKADIQSILDESLQYPYCAQAQESGYGSLTPSINSNPSSARETPVDIEDTANLETLKELNSINFPDVTSIFKHDSNVKSKIVKPKRKYRKRQVVDKKGNSCIRTALDDETAGDGCKRKHRTYQNHKKNTLHPKNSLARIKYMLFSRVMRPKIRSYLPEIRMPDCVCMMARLWNDLPERYKAPFNDAALRIRLDTKMKVQKGIGEFRANNNRINEILKPYLADSDLVKMLDRLASCCKQDCGYYVLAGTEIVTS
ncbi:uncharacterized protein TRIADDRAFT_51474 [Trichoplax adhaerens]|uniref:HMG box domain-containing protein n=1 Tax=Trichoplax adhaerens TaxID=10228 RepID=B3RJB1_TRIAD|nr:predicted protein [Trichoplax adhaerens]EDV28502.1 predicted protein [Trichoplax adhaerens]|eukprot:XP_002107704.1 predicted protein [Trichoplax adhaerens]